MPLRRHTSDSSVARAPLLPGGIAERLDEMGFGLVRTGQDAAGAGDELLEPGRSRSA
jgi:hypothetical protein